MKNIIINCPRTDCRKMLMKDTYLRPGSYLTTRCYYCGEIINVVSENGRIILSTEGHECPKNDSNLPEDDDGDIINMHL
jgi:hypothetical protein